MFQLVLVACMCGLAASALTPTPTEQFDNHVVLDPDRDYHVYWKFDEDFIIFEAHVRTNGWVGFGLSNSGNMLGADLIVAWIDSSGTPHFYDTYAQTPGQPRQDDKQDWWLTDAKESGGVTLLRFYRHLKSCDVSGQDMDIVDSTQRLIYAYGPTDPVDLNSLPKHANNRRGTLSTRLLIPNHQRSTLPADAWSHDVTQNNVQVPTDPTTYWCSFQSFPKPQNKQHIIKVEPVINAGNERLVHHIVMYVCPANTNSSFLGQSHSCQSPNMPRHGCTDIIGTWAIGGGTFDFPDHVGLPVGSTFDSDMILVEIHLDNPDQLSTYVDSSGLRFHMTPSLRREDAGVIQTGMFVSPGQVIPPQFQDFKIRGFCDTGCFTKAMSDASVSSIHVFSTLLHSHLLGRKLSTRVIRNNQEIDNLGVDDFYDFNFQEFRALPREIEIKPGDTLVTECSMDSTSRNAITYGGLGTSEEMCLNFVLYYPRLPMTGCWSGHDTRNILRLAGATDFYFDFTTFQWLATAPPNLAGLSALDVTTSQDWSDSSIRSQFATLISGAETLHDAFCGVTTPYMTSNLTVPRYTAAPASPSPAHCTLVTGAGARLPSGLAALLVLPLLLA